MNLPVVFWAGCLAHMALLTSAAAQELGVTIVEYGIYTAETVRTERLPSGFSTNVVQNICHLVTTEAIPAEIGQQFGVRFRVDGAPAGAIVELQRVTRFPTPVTPPSNPKAQPLSAHNIQTRIGAVSYAGFGFDHDWEVVKGPWVIELWHDDRVLARQHFEIGDGPRTSDSARASRNCFQLSASLATTGVVR